MADATDKIEMSWMVNAKPKAVMDAWLSSEGHTAMTGGGAVVEGSERGPFTAWDGYIFGKTTKIDRKARRIVQTWRTMDFKKAASDSRIDVTFKAHKGKTQVMLKHTKLTPGDGAKYTVGWYQHYLEPMQRHFGA
jgi:activator of HSP90 ATPase